MMNGKLYIDGNDAYLQFGVYVISGGWNELLALPPLKTVKSNDWQEEDGIEADLEAPVLNTRELTMKFAISGAFSHYYDFLALLGDGAYHTFRCEEIGRTFRLRLVSHSNLDTAKILGFLSVKFADDFPLLDYTYAAPTGGGVPVVEDYCVDDIPLTDYGVRVLQGSLDEVMKGGTVKQAMLRNIASQGGAQYDSAGAVHYKSKDVKLTCLLRADSLSEMWRNYLALLHDLTQPEERLLFVAALEAEFPFYYKSCSVKDFSPVGRVWLEFTLTVVFTGCFRLDEDDMILATEDGIAVYTEDDEYAINVRPNRFAYPTLRFVNTEASMRLTSSGTMRFNN